MDKFPLLLEGRPAGELTAEYEPLYTLLSARCPLPDGLWCAWAVGERGVLRLGVLEPQNGCGFIRRRFSHRLTAPLGRILRGEVRPNGVTPEAAPSEEPSAWSPVPAPERLFRTPWLRQRMQGRQGVLACPGMPAPDAERSQTNGQPSRQGETPAPGQAYPAGQTQKQGPSAASGQSYTAGQMQKQGQSAASGQSYTAGQTQKQGPSAASGQSYPAGQTQKQGPSTVSGQPSKQGQAGRNRGGFRIALPWDPGQPFPLPPLFCFARLQTIGKDLYLVFSFDGREWPLF